MLELELLNELDFDDVELLLELLVSFFTVFSLLSAKYFDSTYKLELSPYCTLIYPFVYFSKKHIASPLFKEPASPPPLPSKLTTSLSVLT